MARKPTPKAKFRPRADKSETDKVCLCGCGGHPKGRFLPGHDAKLKGRLKKEALGDDADVAAAAVKRLASLGWSWALDTTPEAKAARKAGLEAAKIEKAERLEAAQQAKDEKDALRAKFGDGQDRNPIRGVARRPVTGPAMSPGQATAIYQKQYRKLLKENNGVVPHKVIMRLQDEYDDNRTGRLSA